MIKQNTEAFLGQLFGNLVSLLKKAMQRGSSAMRVLIMDIRDEKVEHASMDSKCGIIEKQLP